MFSCEKHELSISDTTDVKSDEPCIECLNSNFKPIISSIENLNSSKKNLPILRDYLTTQQLVKIEELDLKNSKILSYENSPLRVIWAISKHNNAFIKKGYYFYVYEDIIQIGYEMNYEKFGENIKITHYNADHLPLYSVTEDKNKNKKLEQININKEAFLAGKNIQIYKNLSNAKVGCSFYENIEKCVMFQAGQIGSNFILVLTCMYFGPECATAVGISCATKAAVATSQGNCL